MFHIGLIRLTLLLIEVFVGLSAMAGGYWIVAHGGYGMPLEWLEGSVFKNFLWPGVILGLIVGGTNLLAAWKTLTNSSLLEEYSATAGFGLLIWIFVEMYIIRQSHPLHSIYFGLSLIILILVMLHLKYQRRSR